MLINTIKKYIYGLKLVAKVSGILIYTFFCNKSKKIDLKKFAQIGTISNWPKLEQFQIYVFSLR